MQIGNAGNPIAITSSDAILFVGVSSAGMLTVVGANSSVVAAGSSRTHPIGAVGGTGTLIVSDDASVRFGSLIESQATLDVGVSNSNGSHGTVLVESDSLLRTGNLSIGTRTSTATGLVIIDGTDSSIIAHATTTIGSTSGGTGTLNVNPGAVLQTDTLDLRSTGTLNVDNATVELLGAMTMAAGSTFLLDDGVVNVRGGLDNSGGGTIDFRDGSLTITDGAFVPGAGPSPNFILNAAGGFMLPTLTLGTGVTSEIGQLTIGQTNSAYLKIIDGATVTSQISTLGFNSGFGQVDLVGTDSSWSATDSLTIGNMSSQGIVNVTDGATLSTVDSDLGLFGDSGGTVNITGANSSWTDTGEMRVGVLGEGALNITGGIVNSDRTLVGRSTGGIGTVEIAGSGAQFNSGTSLSVGHFGNGTLEVRASGEVNTPLLHVGERTGSTGVVDVSGFGTDLNVTGNLNVGGDNSSAGAMGTLDIHQGGDVSVGDTLTVWPSGTVNLADSGSELIADGIDHTHGGAFNFNSGTLAVGQFTGELTNSAGLMTVGNTPGAVGTTVVTGEYKQLAGATLRFEVGNLATLDHDQLQVTDSIDLDGVIDIVAIAGFQPRAGDEYVLIISGGLIFNFPTVNSPDLPGDLFSSTVLTGGASNDLIYTIYTPYTADFDGDGDVDADDLMDPIKGWQARYGADLDGRNFLDWQRQFGSGVGAVSSSLFADSAAAAIPEPSTTLLACVLLLGVTPPNRSVLSLLRPTS
ncbi:beta strand repeat-containing protein [Bythopirellula polymerisocia]|uniref:Uncharacterized protein n=1 Tax=Bythopirellula polymerisocia TaxID=2528003 RepID=A0A5C6D4P9_9BACT|nr:hypothetical protein [Bythopirellula polymerisocia]TWU30176.1 hypothetical protein Pla144_09620 [Bythopirellula polymerisocia]